MTLNFESKDPDQDLNQNFWIQNSGDLNEYLSTGNTVPIYQKS
jgi:hypothetical protein